MTAAQKRQEVFDLINAFGAAAQSGNPLLLALIKAHAEQRVTELLPDGLPPPTLADFQPQS